MKFERIKVLTQGLKTWATKNSPVILTGVGIAGLITTAVLASKATLKAHEIVQEAEETETYTTATGKTVVEKIRLRTCTKVKLAWKCYIPTVIVGASSIACVIGGTVQSQKRLAAISALYSLSEQALKEYQESTKEISSKVTPDAVNEKTLERKLSQNPPCEENTLNTGHGDTLFFDSYCGRYFKSDIDFVKRVVNDLNYSITHGEGVTLNEFYINLDLPALTEWHGNCLGWNDRTIEMMFTSKLTDNDTPCICIDFKSDGRPMVAYEFY